MRFMGLVVGQTDLGDKTKLDGRTDLGGRTKLGGKTELLGRNGIFCVPMNLQF